MQTMQPDETRSLRLKDVANQPVIAPQQRSYLHIRHGERELAELFENATVGLRDVGPNGIIVAVNRAELNLLGYSPDEYIGHHIAEFHADKEVACDILRRLRAGEELHGYEARMVCKDGAIKHVVIHSNVSRADGRFAYMRCLTLDITKQKRAQQRLAAYDAVTRALASSSALDTAAMEILRAVCDYLDWQVGVLWHVDGDARVLRCAALWHLPGLEIPRFTAATRQQTFERGTGLPGQVWGTGRAVWIPHASSEINFLRAGIADSEGLHAAFAFPIVIKDEVLGVIEFWSQETRQPDEDLLQMMTGIGSQIGQFIERKQAEERLRRKEEQLQQLNAELEKRVAERTAELVSSIGERENLQRQLLQAQKMESLGTLAGGIAHDFNNLLNIILGYTLLLEHKGYRGDPSEALDIIKQTVNRAAVLVQQLLAIARKTEIKFQEIDINGRILSLKQLLKATFPKTVEVVLELDPSVPAVLADPGQIDQVLLNLCVNARDAMPNGGSLVLATSVVAGDEL
ncbi:MAG TPA: PAS domain S-box protein, partial [Candidatus Eisenbacteria bacterium]|nr:PAS domain S-box protein [Candidatus Eisenbacteria bacterium]